MKIRNQQKKVNADILKIFRIDESLKNLKGTSKDL